MTVGRSLRRLDRRERRDLEQLIDHRGDALVEHAARFVSGARREKNADHYSDDERA
jgi:hypothetical protein